jgi:hypothetical protein
MGRMKQNLIANKEHWLLAGRLIKLTLYGNHLNINAKNYQLGG